MCNKVGNPDKDIKPLVMSDNIINFLAWREYVDKLTLESIKSLRIPSKYFNN